ncbi:hypothetical protein [Achromobacter denitrificans]|uniref:hypothetical protein n=1 Tax=Achromobacter denitrificans TaxID=32002 RepID=UPI0011250B0F|nr:hypothetical protein [Achromobacter denitrificans]
MNRAKMPIFGAALLIEIPFAMIEPHEAQAKRNHGQTLDHLAARGGLSVPEALDIIEGRRIGSSKNSLHNEQYLIELVRDWRADLPLCARADLEVMTRAARDVLAERKRQVEVEGMTNEADDSYRTEQLPCAAASYILHAHSGAPPALWPWTREWWKPRDARSNYVRACALLLAEIERLDRAAGKSQRMGDKS